MSAGMHDRVYTKQKANLGIVEMPAFHHGKELGDRHGTPTARARWGLVAQGGSYQTLKYQEQIRTCT